MARVPVVTQPSAVERPVGTPYKRLDVPAGAFGLPQAQARARRGQALMATGEVLGNIAVQRMREDNERKAKDIDNQYVLATDKLDHGDGTPDNPGFFNMLGQDAEDNYPKLAERRQKLRNDLLAGAGPTVQKLAGDSMTARDIIAGRQYAQHLGRQRQVAQQATAEARINLAARTAQNNYGDPTVVNENLRIAAAEAAAQADRMGLTGPAALEAVLEATSPVVAGAAAAALTAGNTVAAEAIFAQHGAKMTAKARLSLAKTLQETTDRRLAEEKAQAIMDTTGGNIGQALQLIEGIADPAQREEVTRRVVNMVNLQERAKQQTNQQTLDYFKRVVMETGSTDVIPPEAFSRADPEVVMAAKAFEANWAKTGSIFPNVSDPEVRDELHNLMLREPDKFASTDLSMYQSKLTEAEYKAWQGRQRTVAEKPQTQASYSAARAWADSFADELMVKNKAGRGALAAAAEAEVDRAVATGEPLSREKVRDAMRLVATRGDTRWFSEGSDSWLNIVGTEAMQNFIPPGQEGWLAWLGWRETVGEMAASLGLSREDMILRVNSLLAQGKPINLETLSGKADTPAPQEAPPGPGVSIPLTPPPETNNDQGALLDEARRLLEFNKMAVTPENIATAVKVLREHRGRE